MGMNEGDIVKTEETEDGAQIGLLVIHGVSRTGLRIITAARRQHVNLLAGQQSLGAIFRVFEGAADAGDMIDPSLQARWQAEVMHGRTDDDDIGGFQFPDQLIGKGDPRLLVVATRINCSP